MAALITEDQFEARIGRSLSATEQTRFAALATDASALVRRYTRHQFDAVTGEIFTGRPVGTKIRLPKTPVTDVTSVTAVGWAGLPDIVLPAAGGWGWDGLDIIEVYPLSAHVWISLPETFEFGGDYPDTYRVVYDFGEEAVPDEIIAIVFAMIARTLLSPTMIEALTSEHIGKYSYQLGQFAGGGAPGAAVRLLEVDKDALQDAGYRPVKRSSAVQIGI